jgi:uncharacterized membrane protein YqjE
MASKASLAAVSLLLGIMALIAWAPESVTNVLHNLFALSNVAIFVFAAAVLAWFVYAVILRRILRARRIANARMRRMMREAADRQKL